MNFERLCQDLRDRQTRVETAGRVLEHHLHQARTLASSLGRQRVLPEDPDAAA